MTGHIVVVSLLPMLLPVVACAADGITPGKEFLLLANGPGNGIQATPAAAHGGGIFLVVWREGWHGKGGSARIFAARVSEEGNLLDARSIGVVPTRAGVEERPRVAFADGIFLVVWQVLRDGRDYDVFGARIDVKGNVVDHEPIAIAATSRNQVLPDVASDGKRFVVVWQSLTGGDTSYRGYAAPVSVEGEVGPAVETGITPQPRIAWNGSQYLLAGGGAGTFKGNVHAVRLHADGSPRGNPVSVIRGSKAAAFSLCGVPERGWLVVSHRSPPDPWGWGGPGAIRAASVNNGGQTENQDAVKEPAGVKERLPGWLDIGRVKTEGATWPWGPNACAFDGRRPVVVWQRHHLCGEKMTNFENCDLIAARVSGHRSLDPHGIAVAASMAEENSPALAGGREGRLLLVYTRSDDDGRVSVVARILATE